MACSTERRQQIIEAARRELGNLVKMQEAGYTADVENGIDDIEAAIDSLQAIVNANVEAIKAVPKANDITGDVVARFGDKIAAKMIVNKKTIDTEIRVDKVLDRGSDIVVATKSGAQYVFDKGQDISRTTKAKGARLELRDFGKFGLEVRQEQYSYSKKTSAKVSAKYTRVMNKLVRDIVGPEVTTSEYLAFSKATLQRLAAVGGKYANRKVTISTTPRQDALEAQAQGLFQDWYLTESPYAVKYESMSPEELAVELGKDGVYQEQFGASKESIKASMLEAMKTVKGAHTFAHEMVHAGASEFMKANPEHVYTKRIVELFEEVKSSKEDILFRMGEDRSTYWADSVDEFIAEGLSNPALIYALKYQKTKGRSRLSSVFSEMLETLLKMVGIDRSSNAYEYLLDGYLAMLESQWKYSDESMAKMVDELTQKLGDKEVETSLEDVKNVVLKSEPIDETSGTYTKVVDKKEVYGTKKVQQLFEKLVNEDIYGTSKEHTEHLQKVLRNIVNPTVKALPEITVYLDEKAQANNGVYNASTQEVRIGLGKEKQIYSGVMSAAEKFVHEMVHAATHFAINYEKSETAGLINRLTALRDQAMKVMTWEDLMPEVSINPQVDEKIAKERLQYFNKDLEEFLAYAVTNEKVMKKLATIKVYAREEKVEGFVDTVVHLLGKLVDGVLQFWRKEKNIRGDALALKLLQGFMNANNQAEQEHKQNVFDKIDDMVEGLEEKWEGFLDKVSDVTLKKTLTPPPVRGTRMEKTLWAASVFKELVFNKEARGLFEGVLTSVGLKPEGFVQTQLRLMKEGDDHQERITDVMMWSGQIERAREQQASNIGGMIRSAFTTKIKDKHRTALYGMMQYDGSQLVMKYGKAIEEFYSDEKKLDAEIQKLEGELEKQAKSQYLPLYKARIEDLVNYMETGNGTMITAKNAEAIAKMVGTARPDMKVSDSVIELIDTIVGLKSIQRMDTSTKETVVELMQKDWDGIQVISELYRGGVEQVDNRMGDSRFNRRKGHLREVYDDAVTSAVAPLRDKKKMLEKGYTEVVVLPKSKALGALEEPMALYISKDMIRQKLNRSTMRYTGDKQEGRTIFEQALKTGKAEKAKMAEMRSRLRAEQTKEILTAMQGKAIEGDNVLVPVYDAVGKVVDYRYNVSMEQKVRLGLETDGIESVARIWAHEVDEAHSEEINEAAFNEMVFQMAKDYRGASIGMSGHEYIMLSEDSDMALAKEYTRILPPSVKKLMKELKTAEIGVDGKINEEMAKKFVGVGWNELSTVEKNQLRKQLGKKEIWIRRDMVHDILGVRDYSIINTWGVRDLPVAVKTALLRFENFWKAVIQLFKVNIIIKVPAVLLENIISNFMYSVQTGQSPLETFKTQKEGWDALNRYIKDEQKLRELEAKLVVDKGNKQLVMMRDRLKDDMKRSPIRPLIDAGLYSHIIEDINPETFKSSNKVASWIDEKMENAPEIIRDGVNWLYLTERTSYFQMVQSATAKSDFVARYAQYVFQTKRLQKKEAKRLGRALRGDEGKDIEKQVLRQVRDAFINYTRLDDPFMQYMNDMGVLMFSKYAIRITRHAKDLFTRHPIRFVMALLAQDSIEATVGYDPADIVESSVFTKGITDWVWTPEMGQVFEELLTPAAVRNVSDALKAV